MKTTVCFEAKHEDDPVILERLLKSEEAFGLLRKIYDSVTGEMGESSTVLKSDIMKMFKATDVVGLLW